MLIIILIFFVVVIIGGGIDYRTYRHKKRREKHYRNYKQGGRSL